MSPRAPAPAASEPRFDVHAYVSADDYHNGLAHERPGLSLYEAVKLAARTPESGWHRAVVVRAGGTRSSDEVYDSALGYLVDPDTLLPLPASATPPAKAGPRSRLSPLAAGRMAHERLAAA